MPRPNSKLGTLSNEERKFILDNMDNLEIDVIAKQLNRSPLVIEKVIRGQMALPISENNTTRWHLRKSLHWKHLKDAFTERELNTIEDQYVKYVEQFKGDIIATEEVQILNLIKVEILMERNLTGKMLIGENIKRYKQMVESLLTRFNHNFADMEEADRATIMELEDKISACLQAEASRTTEYVDLLKQHNALTEKVMGSRDQRVREILSTKVSFTGLVKQLMDRDKQEKDSRFLELNLLKRNLSGCLRFMNILTRCKIIRFYPQRQLRILRGNKKKKWK